jgi:hypothetical protein
MQWLRVVDPTFAGVQRSITLLDNLTRSAVRMHRLCKCKPAFLPDLHASAVKLCIQGNLEGLLDTLASYSFRVRALGGSASSSVYNVTTVYLFGTLPLFCCACFDVLPWTCGTGWPR